MELDSKIEKTLISHIDNDRPVRTYVYYKYTYIYGWGKNKYGELGLGSTNNTTIPLYFFII
jgi:hypothetical protein